MKIESLKHTTGKWSISESDPFVIVSESEGTDIATLAGWADENPAQFEANRNLIASAPELLEALCEISALPQKYHMTGGGDRVHKLMASIAKKAISKAKNGGTPE